MLKVPVPPIEWQRRMVANLKNISAAKKAAKLQVENQRNLLNALANLLPFEQTLQLLRYGVHLGALRTLTPTTLPAYRPGGLVRIGGPASRQ